MNTQSKSKTQAEAAHEIGISEGHLNAVLCGRLRASALTARRIEEVLGVPKETLRPDVFGKKPTQGGAQ